MDKYFLASVRAKRKEMKFSQEAVAKYLGVSRRAYISFEKGESNFKTKERLTKLCELLDITEPVEVDEPGNRPLSKEEMPARISELEAEVRQLKNAITKEKISRALCPKEVAVKYGGLTKRGIAWEYNHFPFMSYTDLTNLSRVIRRCCFIRPKLERRGPRTKYDCGKTLKSLNDEEYSKYCEILDKCLAVFSEYGVFQDNY